MRRVCVKPLILKRTHNNYLRFIDEENETEAGQLGHSAASCRASVELRPFDSQLKSLITIGLAREFTLVSQVPAWQAGGCEFDP